MDRLTVKGVGKRVDGDYDCDLRALLVDVSSPDALLVSEAETIKRLSGAVGYGIGEAFANGDWIVRMAVATVVLARHGVDLTEQQARKATVGAFTFELEPVPDEEVDEADPREGGETPSSSGGASGSPTSDGPPASDQQPTGRLASVAS
jgi:hypothetical protein